MTCTTFHDDNVIHKNTVWNNNIIYYNLRGFNEGEYLVSKVQLDNQKSSDSDSDSLSIIGLSSAALSTSRFKLVKKTLLIRGM